jgi:hypothetical protein
MDTDAVAGPAGIRGFVVAVVEAAVVVAAAVVGAGPAAWALVKSRGSGPRWGQALKAMANSAGVTTRDGCQAMGPPGAESATDATALRQRRPRPPRRRRREPVHHAADACSGQRGHGMAAAIESPWLPE